MKKSEEYILESWTQCWDLLRQRFGDFDMKSILLDTPSMKNDDLLIPMDYKYTNIKNNSKK